jgi:hypothetical protein
MWYILCAGKNEREDYPKHYLFLLAEEKKERSGKKG